MPRRDAARMMFLALVASPFAGDRASAREARWRHDSSAPGRRRPRPLLLGFGTEWCGPCRKLDAPTPSDPRAAAALNERFAPVKLDGDTEAGLTATLRVAGFPAVTAATSEGRVVGRHAGYPTPAHLAALPAKAPAPVARPAGKPVAAIVGGTAGAGVSDAGRVRHVKFVVALDSGR